MAALGADSRGAAAAGLDEELKRVLEEEESRAAAEWAEEDCRLAASELAAREQHRKRKEQLDAQLERRLEEAAGQARLLRVKAEEELKKKLEQKTKDYLEEKSKREEAAKNEADSKGKAADLTAEAREQKKDMEKVLKIARQLIEDAVKEANKASLEIGTLRSLLALPGATEAQLLAAIAHVKEQRSGRMKGDARGRPAAARVHQKYICRAVEDGKECGIAVTERQPHVYRAHLKQANLFECPLCDYTASYLSRATTHINLTHKNAVVSAVSNEQKHLQKIVSLNDECFPGWQHQWSDTIKGRIAKQHSETIKRKALVAKSAAMAAAAAAASVGDSPFKKRLRRRCDSASAGEKECEVEKEEDGDCGCSTSA